MTQSDIINNNFSKAFECIKCSNAYNTGEVLSEEKLFKQISERKHSTFDLSKFTVVGNPTITDDGVASGFKQSDCLYSSLNEFSTNNDFEINGDFISTSIGTQKTLFMCRQITGSRLPLALIVNASKLMLFASSSNDSYDIANAISGTHTLKNNIRYFYKVKFSNGVYSVAYSTDKTNWITDITVTNSLHIAPVDNIMIGNGIWQPLANETIDLKQFSITVDGKEVFSGNKTGTDTVKIGNETVEIPYTLSKTGSKIVDVAYRDRVIDLYEQEGQAGYYTIDEDNKNFTLPMGEIYGMIGDFSSTGGSGLELCDIGMTLYVDETKGLRRYLNGQIVDINTNTQKFLNRLKQITTLHPSLLCTEEEWQTAKTMSAFGQVGKFVFNYSGDEIVSVRLPRVVNVQGLFDLQNLGMTVSAGLPNITGTAQTAPGRSGYIANGALAVYVTQNATNVFGTEPMATSTQYGISFNASRSNPIYGNSNTVQQEAIQYPYFIQIATGSETENNIINEIELNNPYSLFDSKYSDHELNNLSWLKSAGQWNAKAVYTDAYNELLTEYNNAESVEETEGTVTFKRTPKGYKIALADQETAIDTKYATYGIAWYYILDTTNTQFKLPRTKYGFEGLRTNVGDKIDESLPNIKAGRITTSDYGDIETEVTGAWEGSSNPNSTNLSSGNTSTEYFLSFNASRSSSTYKDNAPVQERATQMYLYFYVGETVQNANLIDAGRISEVIPNKLDKKQLYNKITNCLLEVPQRIKYTLENGTLTIKAGSVVIVPYGMEDKTADLPKGAIFINENFKVYDTQFSDGKFFVWAELVNDVSDTPTVEDRANRPCYIDFARVKPILYKTEGSGTTNPSSGTGVYFNTNDNKVVFYNSGAITDNVISLPILRGTSDGTHTVGSINQVFNGMGYIGSTVWVDKGVKGLMSNGRNADGSLINEEVTTDKLYTLTIPSVALSWTLGYELSDGTDIIPKNHLITDNSDIIYEQRVMPTGTGWKWIDTANNQVWFKDENNPSVILHNPYKLKNMFLGKFRTVDDKIISFAPKLPFRAADENDLDGRWMRQSLHIINKDTVFPLGSQKYRDYDISSYLPNDGHIYELAVEILAFSGSSTNATAHWWVSDTLGVYQACSCGGRAYSDARDQQYANGIIPMASRTLRLYCSSSGKAPTIGVLRLTGYRKVR